MIEWAKLPFDWPHQVKSQIGHYCWGLADLMPALLSPWGIPVYVTGSALWHGREQSQGKSRFGWNDPFLDWFFYQSGHATAVICVWSLDLSSWLPL
jgi:hypothetical protein